MSHDGFECVRCGYSTAEYDVVVCPKCKFSFLDEELTPYEPGTIRPFCNHEWSDVMLRCRLCGKTKEEIANE